MATKAINFKFEESEIVDMKEIAGIFHISLTDFFKEAARKYAAELKKDPYYRLTVNVKDASIDESGEILAEIESLTDDDLTIASTKRFSL